MGERLRETIVTDPLRCASCHRVASYQLGRGAAARAACFRHLVSAPDVVRRAALTALVVGSLLVGINQGDLLLSGELSWRLVSKVALTYCVPYCVTTWGVLGGARLQRR